MSLLCVYFNSGKVVWTASSKSIGFPPLFFGNPIRIGRTPPSVHLSPVPGVYCLSISKTCLSLSACLSRCSYPILIVCAAFILVSVILWSVSITAIRISFSAFCISTPPPDEPAMLSIVKYSAPAIFPVSTSQISSLWALGLLSGE